MTHNINQACNFLKAFRPEGMINLIAINPSTKEITGITRHINHTDLREFLQDNIKCNLYFSPNEPTPNAPDKKLLKKHIDKIHAVWIDADPDKEKDFDEERIRLFNFADELRNSTNPPTYVIDSGGGIQAFWVLKEPAPATDDNILLYEAYSRSLAEQYGTDRVQNIDRIMRIPFTINLPTKKKKGRKAALTNVYYASSMEGLRYD